jgi:hypothetical protein
MPDCTEQLFIVKNLMRRKDNSHSAGVAVLAHCNFSYRFFFEFGLMTTVCRERLQYDLHIEIGIGARKLARHFYRFVLVRHGCPLSDFDVGVML